MSKRTDDILLYDVYDAGKMIIEFTQGMTYKNFYNDRKTQDAVIRNFEVMGEAVKNISQHFRSETKHIPWSRIAKFRDKLIHDYFGIDTEMVWDVIEDFLPPVVEDIKEELQKLGEL